MIQIIESIRAFFAQFFIERSSAGIEFSNPGYYMPIITLGVLLILLFLLRKRIQGWRYESHLRNTLGLTVLLLVPAFSWANIYAFGGSASSDLPLQLCSFAMMFSGLMMIKNNSFFFHISFFMGLIGGLAALLIPSWNIDPTCFRYYQFYGGHSLIIFNSFYMIFVLKKKITPKSYLIALLSTLILGVSIYPVNALLGTNYFFSHHGPSELGLETLVYPLYFFVWAGGIAFAYLIFLLPWILKKRTYKVKKSLA